MNENEIITRGRESTAQRRLNLPANPAPCDVTRILSSADFVLLPALRCTLLSSTQKKNKNTFMI